jgi:hypothetical protein
MGKFDIKDWYENYYYLKRQFTVKTEKSCEVLYLDLHSLTKMSTAFPEDFQSIFSSVKSRYIKSLFQKLKVLLACQKIVDKSSAKN